MASKQNPSVAPFRIQPYKDNMGRIDQTRLMRPPGKAWVQTSSRFNTSFAFIFPLKSQFYCINNSGRNQPLWSQALGAVIIYDIFPFCLNIVLISCQNKYEAVNFYDCFTEKRQ